MNTLILFISTYIFLISQSNGWEYLNIENANFRLSHKAVHFHEIRLVFNGTLALDTAIPGWDANAVFLRQVAHGNQFIQLIYHHEGLLLNCEIVQDDNEMLREFLDQTFWLIEEADIRNNDIRSISSKFASFDIINDVADLTQQENVMLDFYSLRSQCLELKDEINTAFSTVLLNSKAPMSLGEESYGSIRRFRRASLIYPSTKWCGAGSVADHDMDLGNYTALDQCCRAHDKCDTFIAPLTSAYNYFNYGLTTISHCDCDSEFYDCLKAISGYEEDAAQMVGQLFFNFMNKNCFLFRRRPVCKRRSIWGYCLRYYKDYTAVPMSSLVF